MKGKTLGALMALVTLPLVLFAGLVGEVSAKSKEYVDFRAVVPAPADDKKNTYVLAPEKALGGAKPQYLEVAAPQESQQVLHFWLDANDELIVSTYVLVGAKPKKDDKKQKSDCVSCHPGDGFGGGGAPPGPGPSEPSAPRSSTASGEVPADSDSTGTSTGSRDSSGTTEKGADATSKKSPPKKREVTGGFTLSVIENGCIVVKKYQLDPTNLRLKGNGPFEVTLEGTSGPAPLVVFVGRADEADPKSPLAVRARTRVIKK